MIENNEIFNELKEKINDIDHYLRSISNDDLKKYINYGKSLEVIPQDLGKVDELIGARHSSTKQLMELTNDIVIQYTKKIKQALEGHYSNDERLKIDTIFEILDELSKEFSRLEYLSLIKDRNVVLVGGNGVGKSSFASFLKESLSESIVVIPAEKFLFYEDNLNDITTMSTSEVQKVQNENYIEFGRNHQPGVKEYFLDLEYLFSKIITIAANRGVKEILGQYNIKEINKSETILGKINSIWNLLIPDIEIGINTDKRILEPNKNGHKYPLNSMSDGEKVILYYISQVMLAEKDSFIIIDEPETFLNPSIFSRLWDMLEQAREDCKFIYISHVVNFVISRTNVDLLWCKKFRYPNEWDIQRIDNTESDLSIFSSGLLTELLGSRKSILFCEGKRDSLDYRIYSSLFGKDFIVFPIDGHNNVIEYTKAYNTSPILDNNCAYGIIDGDLIGERQREKYSFKGVFTLSFNEIEMILLLPEVIKNVLSNHFGDSDSENKIEKFKKKFFEMVESDKEEIIDEKMKLVIDNLLKNHNVEEIDSASKMKEDLKNWVSDLKIEDMESKFKEKLDEILDNQNYIGLLEISNQKKKISKGLANKELDDDYEERALQVLKKNASLREEIISKYFMGFKEIVKNKC